MCCSCASSRGERLSESKRSRTRFIDLSETPSLLPKESVLARSRFLDSARLAPLLRGLLSIIPPATEPASLELQSQRTSCRYNWYILDDVFRFLMINTGVATRPSHIEGSFVCQHGEWTSVARAAGTRDASVAKRTTTMTTAVGRY